MAMTLSLINLNNGKGANAASRAGSGLLSMRANSFG